MATLVIDELNDDLVYLSKEMASKFGAKTKLVPTSPRLATSLEHDKLAFNRALQTMPILDGYDDIDIFAREPSVGREIDWMP